MFHFLKKSQVLGIEITPFAVRVARLSQRGLQRTIVSAAKAELSPGTVSCTYPEPNILDEKSLTAAIQTCIGNIPARGLPAALSLPDTVFRVQTLEFDKLPPKNADRERLIRWRMEKTAAFDIADTVLQYQVLSRPDAGFTILACFAKQTVINQYEKLLQAMGFEPWTIGVASFHTLNFYAPYMTKKTAISAFTHITGDAFTTIVSESGGARFYRFKDLKRGSAEDLQSRIVREIEDSLHFFTHMDRLQQSEVGHLYLAGEQGTGELLAEELKSVTALSVETLTPSLVLVDTAGAGPDMAAVLGAGKTI